MLPKQGYTRPARAPVTQGASPVTRWLAARLLPLVGLLLLLHPQSARAQATGTLTGALTDNSGGALPGVTVEATNEDTAAVRTTVTGSDGFFTFPLMTPGKYQ